MIVSNDAIMTLPYDITDEFIRLVAATASRDLKKGIDQGLFGKFGAMNTTKYRKNQPAP
ncbi:hypothetical protein [Flavihumibacter sp. UBA7668]|uniref:hypothetical protein n=1 Tax=Flavihumibacter sp. UBA7668 TaxID=1946542 RepID=UPI0025B8E948|nr:hypothetical protein [Flavihumibacter sp. UBA7668]